MTDNFNTYLDHIETDFWRDLCVNEGGLLHFAKGEEFASKGHVARNLGYVQKGTMKYVAYSDDGKDHVVELARHSALFAILKGWHP